MYRVVGFVATTCRESDLEKAGNEETGNEEQAM